MAVNGFWHGGLTVSDMRRSHAFYVGLLGLELLTDRTTSDATLLSIVATDASALRISMLGIPGSPCYVELIEYVGAGSAASLLPASTAGTGHLCFYVEDLGATWNGLQSAGIAAISPGPVDCSSRIPGTWCMYVRDPDGYPIELFEGPRYPDGRRPASTGVPA